MRRQGIQEPDEWSDEEPFSWLILPEERRVPIVTVHDAASHALSFLGGVYGVPVISLGVDQFGQSGGLADLYRATGIDSDSIVAASLHALELSRSDH
jgi:pyruvate dehydrogenase E1 component